MANEYKNKFYKQCNWILKKENLDDLDCPKVYCKDCIVSIFINKSGINGCSPDVKIKAAKNYLRKEKFKRILN